jgi:hypothetical protein
MKLMRSQKDDIYDLIVRDNLSPSQFEFSEVESKMVSNKVATILKFKQSDYFFTFETVAHSNEPHYAIYSPGKYSYEETNYTRDWVTQFRKLQDWLIYLKREINTPNKWDRFINDFSDIQFLSDIDTSKFAIPEFEELKLKISFLKDSISESPLIPTHIELFNSKLDYLLESAKTMNKFDWKSLFVGSIISIIIQLSVSPDNAKLIWGLIRKAFSNFLLD